MMGLAFAHHGHGFGPLGFGGLGSMFGGLFFVGVVVLVVVLLANSTRRPHAYATSAPTAHVTDPAIQIARERLASGQIDAGQYARIVASLTGAQLPPTNA